jgi:hypothetical protein
VSDSRTQSIRDGHTFSRHPVLSEFVLHPFFAQRLCANPDRPGRHPRSRRIARKHLVMTGCVLKLGEQAASPSHSGCNAGGHGADCKDGFRNSTSVQQDMDKTLANCGASVSRLLRLFRGKGVTQTLSPCRSWRHRHGVASREGVRRRDIGMSGKSAPNSIPDETGVTAPEKLASHQKKPWSMLQGLNDFSLRAARSFSNDFANRLAAGDHWQNMFLIRTDDVQQIRFLAA